MIKGRICLFASLAVAALCVAHARAGTDDATPVKKAKSVLLKIGGALGEDPTPQNPFGPGKRNFGDLIRLIRKIAADPAVTGVELKVDAPPDYARTLDLLRELKALKAAGKKISCYAETMGQSALMLTTVADLLALPPSGGMQLTGVSAEIMYMKDLLALLDVRVHVIHIGAYKSAYENYARSTMSDENRMVLNLLLEEYYSQLVDLIAQNRNIGHAQVEGLFDQLFVEPDDALRAGLIDLVAYEDQYEKHRAKLFGSEVEVDEKYGDKGREDLEEMFGNPLAMFSMLPKLLKPEKQKLPDEPRIAIVYATGPITSGKSATGFDGTVSSMGSDTLVKALKEVAEDDWVRAVILRINSPGGSALASDMIWRATQLVRERKPIIASMGNVAGSGGYWIAMGCNRIMAQPSTLTGSIGVVGMLPDVSQTLKRFGVNVELVGKGPRIEELALMKSGPSEFLSGRIRESMELVYGEFIRKVAEGRGMSPQIVETLARGRVWTGRQAVDLNLIDELGGIEDAIAMACELGGGLDQSKVRIAEYPQAPNFLEALEEQFGGMVSVRAQMKAALAEAGFGDLVLLLDHLAAQPAGLSGGDIVQAVLPFSMSVR